MIVKEQFINSCPKELTVHLREHAPETLEEMAKIADQYLEAHGKQVSAGCLVQSSPPQATAEDIQSCIEGDQLLLACGKKIPLLSSACVQPLSGARSKMPVVKGKIGDKTVDVLRDTGCSGIVVKKELVSKEQYTGDFNCMLLIYNTVRKVPIARITIDTPYLSGEVEVQCLPDAIYDLIIGNQTPVGKRHVQSPPGVRLRKKESTSR